MNRNGYIVMSALLVVIAYLVGSRHSSVPGAGGGLRSETPAADTRSYRRAIERVLGEDKAFSKRIAKDVQSGSSPLEAVEAYSLKMRRIDTSDCPEDFRVAFLRHAQAWRSLVVEGKAQPSSVVEALVQGFVNGLHGELDGGAHRYLRARDAREQEIKATWEDVELLVVKYGAKPSSD